jgi:hypothetical protein
MTAVQNRTEGPPRVVREYVNVAVPRIAEFEAQGYAVVAHVAKGEDWEAVLMVRDVTR